MQAPSKPDVNDPRAAQSASNRSGARCLRFLLGIVLLIGTRANALIGDVNGDGRVDILDARLVANYLVGNATSLPHPENADVNADGKISTADALLIMQVARNIRTSFTSASLQVLTVMPSSGTTGVLLTADFSVFFSEPILNGLSGISLKDTVTGLPVPGTVSLSQDGVIATIFPSDPLQPSRSYIINVSTAITDVGGNPLRQQYSSTFQTQALGVLRLTSVNNSTSAINAVLPQPITVQALSAGGSPVQQVPVQFSAQMGNGVFQPSALRQITVLTDSNGIAQATYQLGGQAMVNTVAIGAVGFSTVPLYSVSTLPTQAVNLRVFSGDGQKGAPGGTAPLPLVVQATDAGGDPISGTTVTFAVLPGQGGFSGQISSNALTDSSGTAASFYTFGSSSGTVTVRASFGGMVGQPAAFNMLTLLPQPSSPTYVVGTVIDAQTFHPLQQIYVYLADAPSVWDWTDGNGYFQLPASPGAHVVEVDGYQSGVVGGHLYPVVAIPVNAVQGQNNDLGIPAQLPELEAGSYLDVSDVQGGTLTLQSNPLWQLYVAPGQAHFVNGTTTGRLYAASVAPDKIPMPLAGGKNSRFFDTIQPLNVQFIPPAQVNFPNSDNLMPGTITDIFTLSYASGTFAKTGLAKVSEDGRTVQSLPGQGIGQGGWHSAPTPAPPTTSDLDGNGMNRCDDGSDVVSCGKSAPVIGGAFSLQGLPLTCDAAALPGFSALMFCKRVPLSPPGECTFAEHQTLQQAVEDNCKSNSCKGLTKDDCGAIRANEASLIACIAARNKINNKCFRGGDPTHQKALQDAINALIICQGKATAFNCP